MAKIQRNKEKQGPSTKGIVAFILLSLLLVAVFRHFDRDIFDALKSLSACSFFVLFSCGFLYYYLEALSNRVVFGRMIEHFTIKNALDLTYTGIFGMVTAFSAGSLPLQSYYLYRNGLNTGSAVGLIISKFIHHKSMIVIYSTIMLLLNFSWLYGEVPNLPVILITSYILSAIIIVFLVLLSSWEQARKFVLWLINKLPYDEKWNSRKERWTADIYNLYTESQALYLDRKASICLTMINFLKLSVLYLIPYIVLRLLGISSMNVLKILALSSIMLLLANSLPNISGIGSVEFSFIMVFSQYLGEKTAEVLLLYRISTYYLPFLFSTVWMFFLHRSSK